MDSFSCPVPISEYKRILLAHGGGGRLTNDLIRNMFRRELENPYLAENHDGAIINLSSGRIAFSTDSFVVTPLFFPGGDIGSLSVHGTVNDLAMCGARPRFLSLAFILEEGLEMESLWKIVCSVERAAASAGVKVVTGDTKVVDRGKCEGLYVTTSGIGEVVTSTMISPSQVKAGDRIIVSGQLGNHGIAVMTIREGLEFDSQIKSDSAPVVEPVLKLLDEGIDVRCFRDPTRGGLASALNEIASESDLGIEVEEASIPLGRTVASACDILGLDPLYVASEGRFIAFVPDSQTEKALSLLRTFDAGKDAAVIGEVTDKHPGLVVLESRIGGKRVLDMLSGEQLPRIC